MVVRKVLCAVDALEIFHMVFILFSLFMFVFSLSYQSDALIKSCSSSVPLTGGAWSPTRPGRKRVK